MIDSLLKNCYKTALVDVGCGFDRYKVDTENQKYRKERWELLKINLEIYKEEMIKRGLLKKQEKSMHFVSSLSPRKGQVFARFQCELCGRVDYKNIPWNHDSNYRIACNCEEKS